MNKLILAISAVALAGCSKQKATPLRPGPPPAAARSLAPDASHQEIEQALAQVTPNPDDRSAVLAEMAAANKQVFAWQAALNSVRPADHRIRFDRVVKGIPIESPFAYNGETVVKEYRDALDALNPEMRAVLTDPSAVPPSTMATPDDEFETKAGKILKAYDHAMRWEALSPYLDYYKQRAVWDVRGYYFLQKVDGLDDKLARWKELAPADQDKYAKWLRGSCLNAAIAGEKCDAELASQEAAGNVLPFYQSYLPYAKAFYDNFFALREPRTDVTWHQDGDVSGPVVPFTKPGKENIVPLAKSLIEAAWRGSVWQLRVDYTDRADEGTTHLIFQAGALPHVNAVAGSEITMDDNIPADSELIASVFQHEFGHVIGFPDCYVEFYDESEKVMVNYQLDLGNIMCSRTGKVTDLHRDAIRAAYGPKDEPRQPSSRKVTRARKLKAR